MSMCYPQSMDGGVFVSVKTLQEVLPLLQQTFIEETIDEKVHQQLLKLIQSQECKDIVQRILIDKQKHIQRIQDTYTFHTGRHVQVPINLVIPTFTTLQDGLNRVFFHSLALVNHYRDIRSGLLNRFYQDILFELMMDELQHAHLYQFIHQQCVIPSSNTLPSTKTSFTIQEAQKIASILKLDFKKLHFTLNDFLQGINIEYKYRRRCGTTNDQPLLFAKLALAHLVEFPDYYQRLTKLEEEARSYWKKRVHIELK